MGFASSGSCLLEMLRASLVDVTEDVLGVVRHYRFVDIPARDFLAIDDHGDVDALVLHGAKPGLETSALG
jgi:hypothetical protein